MASPTVEKYQYGIMHVIRNSFLSQNYHYSNYWDVVAVETVKNSDLEEQFQEKRRDFIHIGRTKDELTERLLMGCYLKDEDIKFISLNGLQCGKHGTISYLGNCTKGITLGKHADILLKSFYNDGYEQCWIVVYKVVCGRQKEVLHIQTPPYREPMQDADCHVSILAPVPTEDCLRTQEIKAQVFMFDKDENGDFLRRPRQCVPIACVKFKRASPIGTDTMAANQTIPEIISTAGHAKDSFTLLKDSLAKMKESFVLLSKETVINSKTNHASPSTSKVPTADVSGRREFQQPPTDQNKRTLKRSETHRKDEPNRRKSTASPSTERVGTVDMSSARCAEPSKVIATGGASSKTVLKKAPQTQKEILKDGKLKPGSTSGERSIASEVTSGVSEKTENADSSLAKKKHGQLGLPERAPRSVSKEPLAGASSVEAVVPQARVSDGKCRLPLDVPAGKEIVNRTDRIHQDGGSRSMPVASNRRTRLIDALPVSLLLSPPSLTSAFSRRPVVVTTSSGERPETLKSILRNPITSTVQNGSSGSSWTCALQTSSSISFLSTETSSARQKPPNCESDTQSKNTSRPAAPKEASSVSQTTANLTYRPKEKVTLNSNCTPLTNQHTLGDVDGLPFHIPTSSPMHANTVAIVSTVCSKSEVESIAEPTLKTCHVTTSLNSTSTASVSMSKYGSTQHKRPTSNAASQRKLSVSVQTSGSSDTQPTQSPVTCSTPLIQSCSLQDKTSQMAQTFVSAKTRDDPVSCVPNKMKSKSEKRFSILSTPEAADVVSPILPSVATVHPYSAEPSNQSRAIIDSSSTTHAHKTEPKSEVLPQKAIPSLNGDFTSTCSNYDNNQAIFLQQNTKHSPTFKECGIKSILKSPPGDCLTKNYDTGKSKTTVRNIPLEAPVVAIPKRNMLLLQHGFISSITKQLASDLNEVANLLRSSKPEKPNHREKQALLSLRDINAKFTELSPICVQYKQLFRHLRNGHSVHLPELDQLYSQEYMMNECCNVLGKVFSEYKTSQLKSENVLQKRSLAIAWLVESKTELISCINNIKGIVEYVVSTCELQSLPGTKCCPPKTESSIEENKPALGAGKDIESKESSTATQKATKENLWSPFCCQDLLQAADAIITEKSAQQDRTPEIRVTTEINNQSTTELSESAATLNVDRFVTLDQSLSESEKCVGAALQTAETTLPLGDCLDNAANEPERDRETTCFRRETLNSCESRRNVTSEAHSEQNGKGGQPNVSECPSVSAVCESSQAGERDTHYSSPVVPGTSSQLRSESDLNGCAMISPEDATASAEHPSVLVAAAAADNDGANDPSSIHESIKTERIDPPDVIAHPPPQVIILGADDFFPPSSSFPGGDTSSALSQCCLKRFDDNRSPSTESCCDTEGRSFVRLQEEVQKQDGKRYESCVSLESKPSIFSQDSLDEIPPLLTPDCAFDYSSIVYSIKSDEPPILEANIDETSSNARSRSSPFGVTTRDSTQSVAIPEDSPPSSVVTQRNPRNSPPLIDKTSRVSPPLVETPRDLPPAVGTPRGSPPSVVTPRDSPLSVAIPMELPALLAIARDSPSLIARSPRNSPPLVEAEIDSSTSVVTPRDLPPLVAAPMESPALVAIPRTSPPLMAKAASNSPALVAVSRVSPILAEPPRDLSTYGAPQGDPSTDTSDLVLLISGTRTSTIIMNCDEMVASDSSTSDIKLGANNDAKSAGNDTGVCVKVQSQVEPHLQTDIQMKLSLDKDVSKAVVKEANEENDKPEDNYYSRVVGELTYVDSVALKGTTDAQDTVNQINVNPMTRCWPDCRQPLHNNRNDNTQHVGALSCVQGLNSDQPGGPDDVPKTELEVHLKPSRLISNGELRTIDLSTSSMEHVEPEYSNLQMQTKPDQILLETASVYCSSPHYGEDYADIILSGVGICGSTQSQYVYKIEPDDDFDPDPVCSYDSPNAPRQPNTIAPLISVDSVDTSRDDQVDHQVLEPISSKPDDNAISFLDHQTTAMEPQVASNNSTVPMEAVVCKSPCSTLPSESTLKANSHEPDNPDNELEPQSSRPQSRQEHANEISAVPHTSASAAHIFQPGVLTLRLSPSESVPTEVAAEPDKANSSSGAQQMSVSKPQMAQSSSEVMQVDALSRFTSLSLDARCASPPTVYTDPPQSPPPETIPLRTVIKQEIIDDLDSLVEMKKSLNPKRTCRKRKRDNKQNEGKPIVVVSDEGVESGCSAPPQKQRCAAWSFFRLDIQGTDGELKDSIARVVQSCSSDATCRSTADKPFRAKAKTAFANRHPIEAVSRSNASASAAASADLGEDKLMDVVKPKIASVCFSSMHSERQIEDDIKKTSGVGGERGLGSEERRHSRRGSGNSLSYDRESVSSGSRRRRSRIRDTQTEKETERKTSRDRSDWKTTNYRSPVDDREHRSTRLPSSANHESLQREPRYRDDRSQTLLRDRSRSRRPNTDAMTTPRERFRRSEGRNDGRGGRSSKVNTAGYEDQTVRSRSTRPMQAASRLFDTSLIGKDLSAGHLDDGIRTIIDPSKLKRQFWSKGHPRFRCHEGCDHVCMTAPTVPQDADMRHRSAGGSGHGADAIQGAGNSSSVQELDILEETLKLNLSMLESSRSDDDGKMESRRGDKAVSVRKGAKRSLLKGTDNGRRSRRNSKNNTDDKDNDETEAKEEVMDDLRSTTSSKRSKTLSRKDRNSDCEDGLSDGLRTNHEKVAAADRYSRSLNKRTSVSGDGLDGMALQPSSCGRSSVASTGSGSNERASREFGDDEAPSLQGISAIRTTKSTQHHTCRQIPASAAATTHLSSAAAAGANAAASVNQSLTPVTYVTQILQTSNFSTRVCFEKHKKAVN